MKAANFIDWWTPKRAITVAVFVLLIVILVMVFGKQIKTAIAEAKLAKNADNLIKEAGTTTISVSLARELANQLETAMRGWGTDDTAVVAALLQLGNDADVYLLIKEFGVRSGQTLPQWIASDYYSWDIHLVNDALASKGIKYRFSA